MDVVSLRDVQIGFLVNVGIVQKKFYTWIGVVKRKFVYLSSCKLGRKNGVAVK